MADTFKDRVKKLERAIPRYYQEALETVYRRPEIDVYGYGLSADEQYDLAVEKCRQANESREQGEERLLALIREAAEGDARRPGTYGSQLALRKEFLQANSAVDPAAHHASAQANLNFEPVSKQKFIDAYNNFAQPSATSPIPGTLINAALEMAFRQAVQPTNNFNPDTADFAAFMVEARKNGTLPIELAQALRDARISAAAVMEFARTIHRGENLAHADENFRKVLMTAKKKAQKDQEELYAAAKEHQAVLDYLAKQLTAGRANAANFLTDQNLNDFTRNLFTTFNNAYNPPIAQAYKQAVNAHTELRKEANQFDTAVRYDVNCDDEQPPPGMLRVGTDLMKKPEIGLGTKAKYVFTCKDVDPPITILYSDGNFLVPEDQLGTGVLNTVTDAMRGLFTSHKGEQIANRNKLDRTMVAMRAIHELQRKFGRPDENDEMPIMQMNAREDILQSAHIAAQALKMKVASGAPFPEKISNELLTNVKTGFDELESMHVAAAQQKLDGAKDAVRRNARATKVTEYRRKFEAIRNEIATLLRNVRSQNPESEFARLCNDVYHRGERIKDDRHFTAQDRVNEHARLVRDLIALDQLHDRLAAHLVDLRARLNDVRREFPAQDVSLTIKRIERFEARMAEFLNWRNNYVTTYHQEVISAPVPAALAGPIVRIPLAADALTLARAGVLNNIASGKASAPAPVRVPAVHPARPVPGPVVAPRAYGPGAPPIAQPTFWNNLWTNLKEIPGSIGRGIGNALKRNPEAHSEELEELLEMQEPDPQYAARPDGRGESPHDQPMAPYAPI